MVIKLHDLFCEPYMIVVRLEIQNQLSTAKLEQQNQHACAILSGKISLGKLIGHQYFSDIQLNYIGFFLKRKNLLLFKLDINNFQNLLKHLFHIILKKNLFFLLREKQLINSFCLCALDLALKKMFLCNKIKKMFLCNKIKKMLLCNKIAFWILSGVFYVLCYLL